MSAKYGSGPRRVYSSGVGRICPDCRNPQAECSCGRPSDAVLGDGKVRVRRETKGRKGKTVTTISGLPLNSDALKELGKELKRLCGTGGATKDGIIEIQGDHCDTLLAALEKRGFPGKRAGG